MAFPATRMRRLRRTGVLRSMVRETELAPAHLVQPLFVELGTESRTPVDAMDAALNDQGGMGGAVAHLAALTLAYGALARIGLRRFA